MNFRNLIHKLRTACFPDTRVSLHSKNTVGTRNIETRHEWVEKTLRALQPGLRILDAGAGEQQYKRHCSHLRYVSQDFAQYDPSKVKAGMQMTEWNYGALDIVCDITRIPEADGSFDVVICFEVLEHVPDPVAALRELARLVRRGGKLIISAPFCSMTHFAPFHYSTGFSRFFYEKHLADLGFNILELSANGNFFEYLAQELRRLESVGAKYAGSAPSPDGARCINVVLDTLQRFSAQDTGSDELLAFGFHVIAVNDSQKSQDLPVP